MKRFAIALAVLLPTLAHGQAFRVGQGVQFKPRSTQPATTAGNYSIHVDSGLSNVLRLCSAAGSCSTVGAGGGGGSGDMILGTTQTVTAAKTFNVGTLKLNNSGNTFAATLATSATAARTNTLPDASGAIALTTLAQTFTAAQVVASVTLSDASTIATDAALSNSFGVTITASRTMGLPTNLVSGGTYNWEIIQGGSGSYTITWNGIFKWPGGSDLLCGSLGASSGGGSYLPLSGGTMSGAITLSGTQLGTYTLGGTPTLGASLAVGTTATHGIGDTTHVLTAVSTAKVIGGSSNTSGHTVPNAADSTLCILAAQQDFTKDQGSQDYALTDGSTVAVDCSNSNAFTLLLTGSGHTMGNPTNCRGGHTYQFFTKQASGGSDTLLWDTKYIFSGGTAPTQTATANKTDITSCTYLDGPDLMYCVWQGNF